MTDILETSVTYDGQTLYEEIRTDTATLSPEEWRAYWKAMPKEKLSTLSRFFGIACQAPLPGAIEELQAPRKSPTFNQLVASRRDRDATVTGYWKPYCTKSPSDRTLADMVYQIQKDTPEQKIDQWITHDGLIYWARTGIFSTEFMLSTEYSHPST